MALRQYRGLNRFRSLVIVSRSIPHCRFTLICCKTFNRFGVESCLRVYVVDGFWCDRLLSVDGWGFAVSVALLFCLSPVPLLFQVSFCGCTSLHATS